jgi:hypothetical protein
MTSLSNQPMMIARADEVDIPESSMSASVNDSGDVEINLDDDSQPDVVPSLEDEEEETITSEESVTEEEEVEDDPDIAAAAAAELEAEEARMKAEAEALLAQVQAQVQARQQEEEENESTSAEVANDVKALISGKFGMLTEKLSLTKHSAKKLAAAGLGAWGALTGVGWAMNHFGGKEAAAKAALK